MKTAGLIPSQKLVSLEQDAQGHWLNVPEGQTVVPLIKTVPPSYNAATQKLTPAAPLWFSDRVERQFSVVNLTASELDELDRAAKKAAVGGIVSTLRSWKADADAAHTSWAGWTTAQRFSALDTLTQRFGMMSDRIADLIRALRLDP